jgi:hypothetical protein
MRSPALAAILAFLSVSCTSPKIQPIPIKVVVVTMFERGADTGDDPGEFQIGWSTKSWTR